MKRKWIYALILLPVTATVFIYGNFFREQQAGVPYEQASVETVAKAMIQYPNGAIELADVADTNVERAQGLSNRETPQTMLFLFDESSLHVFWMKDMRFAIDILWLNNGTIVGITEGMQPEDPPRTFYSAPVPVRTVLEVPAGTVKKFGLQIGNVLDIEWNLP